MPHKIDSAKSRPDLIPIFVLGLTLALLVLFIVYPLAKVVLGSFVENGKEIAPRNFTLANFSQFATSKMYRTAFMNTLSVGALTVLFSCLLGIPMAWFLAKTEMPCKTLFLSLGTLPLILPPFIGAYSWVLLFGRRGMLTLFLKQAIGLALPDIYGAPGVIIAMSLSYYPFVFLLTYGALLSADPYIEESAEIMGASRFRIARTVTLPLVMPALLGAALTVFIRAVGNFGVPALLGGNYYVLPTLIYFQVVGYFDLNAAGAISLVNVALVGAAIALSRKLTVGRSYVTISSTTSAARVSHNRVLKWIGFGFCAFVVLFSLLPHATVIFTSFADHWSGSKFPTKFSFANYKKVFEVARTPIVNSLLLSLAATAAASIVGTLLAYVNTRKGMRARWVLDLTVMMPFILPGIIVGVAILTGFSTGPLVLSGTWIILVIAYFIRRMPYVFRSTTASLGQIDTAIEEASTAAGAPWATTFRRITLPLMLPGILAGAIISFSTLMGELSTTVMLYSARWKTITVSIMEYLFSADIGPAYALGAVLILLVLSAILLANRILGRTMSQMFRMM
jgi:iron(III) transport system permease protein